MCALLRVFLKYELSCVSCVRACVGSNASGGVGVTWVKFCWVCASL